MLVRVNFIKNAGYSCQQSLNVANDEQLERNDNKNKNKENRESCLYFH